MKTKQILKYIQEKKILPLINEYENTDDVNLQQELKIKLKTLTDVYEDINNYLDFNPSNIVFKTLKENYGKYDTLITFKGDESILIPKDIVTLLEGDWVFILGDEEDYQRIRDGHYPLYGKGFNSNHVVSVESLD